jgi:SAM-dependent methyltransferase
MQTGCVLHCRKQSTHYNRFADSAFREEVEYSRKGTMEIDRPATAKCIACRGEARKIGEVPYAYHFLHHNFSTPLDSGDLYECLICGLWFKHPFLSPDLVARFYRDSPDTLSWDNGEWRPDFLCAISAMIQAFPRGGTVLDFGCYKGGFLRLLPDEFQRHGVEPSMAIETASSCKIEILGRDLTSVRDRQFDCITLFDVFEHLLEPLETLDALFAHTRPGGLLCIGTGFADSTAFHRGASKYSYVCMPEHSCFLTKRFLAFLADRFGSEYELSTISRVRPNIRTRIRATVIDCINSPMLLLKSKGAIFRWYPSHRLRVITSRGLLPIIATRDHVVVVFRKATYSQESSG